MCVRACVCMYVCIMHVCLLGRHPNNQTNRQTDRQTYFSVDFKPLMTLTRVCVFSGGCILVLNEVFSKSTQHEKRPTDVRVAGESHTSYGYSFVFSWMVFVVFIVVGLIFLFTSRKRKAEMADTVDVLAQEDEPMQLGRV